MAFDVQFRIVDDYNRVTTRTWQNNQALVATVLTDVAVLAPLLEAIIEGGLERVVITQRSTATAFAAEAASNVDENGSIKVIGGDTFAYDFDLPMPYDTMKNPDGTLDLTLAAVTAFFAEFLTGNFRINLRNPTTIATLVSGVLDK